MSAGGPIAGREVGAGGAGPALPGGGQPVAVRAEIVDLPEALLARLGRALALSGTVLGTAADGVLRVRTQAGEVAVRTATPVPPGRHVAFQIPAQTALQPGPPSPAAPPTPRAPLPIVLLVPAGPPGAPPPPVAGPPTTAGTAPPQPASPAPAPTPAAPMPSSGPPAAAPRAPAPLPPAPAPAGQPNVQPASPTAASPASPPGPMLAAGPVARALDGLPPAAALAAHRPLAAPLPADPPPALPALHATLAALADGDPALAGQVARAVLPRPDGPLAAGLLVFLAAVRGGDVKAWLGSRASRALEAAGRDDLLPRLAAELAPPDRPAPGADWRLHPIPLLLGAEIAPIQLWLRRPDDREADGREAARRGGTRFVIDLDLSRLGPLQLDGLVRERRFDLILRSHRPLARPLRHELSGAFAAACETVGLAGALQFQTGAEGWMRLAARDAATTVRA